MHGYHWDSPPCPIHRSHRMILHPRGSRSGLGRKTEWMSLWKTATHCWAGRKESRQAPSPPYSFKRQCYLPCCWSWALGGAAFLWKFGYHSNMRGSLQRAWVGLTHRPMDCRWTGSPVHLPCARRLECFMQQWEGQCPLQMSGEFIFMADHILQK